MAAGRLVSFVTETEVEELRKKRQEEWEKVRKPGDPKEAPQEANYDPRPLYERLKEQRDKQQEEWDEKFKFKNMIYQGLDDEEAGFLNLVTYQQSNRHAQLQQQERDEINAYKTAVSQLNAEESEKRLSGAPPPPPLTPPPPISPTNKPTTAGTGAVKSNNSKTKLQQKSLIAGAIRRKRTSSESSTGHTPLSSDDPPKSKIIKSTVSHTHQITSPTHQTPVTESKPEDVSSKKLPVNTLISYSSSSDSENEGDS